MNNNIEKIPDVIKFVAIGGAGGGVHYLYKFLKGDEFKFPRFLCNVLIGCYVSWLVGECFVVDDWLRTPAAGLAAITSVEFLKVIEEKGEYLLQLVSDNAILLLEKLRK
jgi:hypothetical protein